MNLSPIFRSLKQPVLASLLQHRVESYLILGVGAAQLGLTFAGLPGLPCPIHAALGIPCPGCGLSRAMASLLHGDWRTSLHTHAFAPIFLAALVMMAIVIILPPALRTRAIEAIARFEQRTAISAVVLIGLVLYWSLRLLVIA
jgi:hypothetical protein